MVDLSWKNIEDMCDNIIRNVDLSNIKVILGIPRGGLIPAIIISHKTGLPLYSNGELNIDYENILVIDDIYDTGKTMQDYIDLGCKIAVLANKATHEKVYSTVQIFDWVIFPWETKESSKVNYKENGKN